MSQELLSSFPGASEMLEIYPPHKLYYAAEYQEDTFGGSTLPFEIEGRVRSTRFFGHLIEHYLSRRSTALQQLREQQINTLGDLMGIQTPDLIRILKEDRVMEALVNSTRRGIRRAALFGPEDRFMLNLFGGEGADVLIDPGNEPARSRVIREALDQFPAEGIGREMRRKHVDLFFGFNTGEPNDIQDTAMNSGSTREKVRINIAMILQMVRASEKGKLLRAYHSIGST